MSISTDRRTALQTFGLGLAGAVGLALETSAAAAADKPVKAPPEKPAPPPAEAKPEPPPPEPPPPQIDSASLPSLVPPGAKGRPVIVLPPKETVRGSFDVAEQLDVGPHSSKNAKDRLQQEWWFD